MAEISPLPVAMDVVSNPLVPPDIDPMQVTPTPVIPEEPENASETLYIQNLNEKIKIDGY